MKSQLLPLPIMREACGAEILLIGMQSELRAAGGRARDLSQRSAQLEAEQAQQRSAAQQAQSEAGRLQGEVKSLAEVLAQRDSDLQVHSRPPAW